MTTQHETRIARHACRGGAACATKLEVHCSCGFGQGARCHEQADAIAHGHRADPTARVISWDPGPPLTTATITDQDLRDLFARHCECRPLDLERGDDDYTVIHACDTERQENAT